MSVFAALNAPVALSWILSVLLHSSSDSFSAHSQ